MKEFFKEEKLKKGGNIEIFNSNYIFEVRISVLKVDLYIEWVKMVSGKQTKIFIHLQKKLTKMFQFFFIITLNWNDFMQLPLNQHEYYENVNRCI